jgi:LPS-assembly lipoprotein
MGAGGAVSSSSRVVPAKAEVHARGAARVDPGFGRSDGSEMSRRGPRDLARRGLLALLLAPLGGCGFHPLYGGPSEQEGETALASVHVERVPERVGQLLTQALRERFNPRGLPVETRYDLIVTLSYGRADLGIQRDSSSTRAEVIMNAAFRLYDKSTGRQLYNGSSRTTSEFNILNDAYSATVAEIDARERGVRALSQDIGLQVAVFLQRDRART